MATMRWALPFLAAGAAAVAARLARRRYDLADAVVVITGGSRGLGFALAREFLRQRACVVIAARDPDTLERARRELAAHGQVLAVPADVTVPADARRLVDAAVARFGTIDVLVNNAGLITLGPLDEMTEDDYARAMDVHFWAPLRLAHLVLPVMRRAGEGRIVNIASIGGIISVPHLLPYAASKSALIGLSEGLRAELAGDGIVVTTVNPGLMRTGSPRHVEVKGRHRLEYTWFKLADSTPLTSIGARRAARAIVAATRRGAAHVVLSPQAKAAAWVHGMSPGLVARVLGWVNRALPRPGGIGARALPGWQSTSRVSESWLTRLTDRAAIALNEVGPAAR